MRKKFRSFVILAALSTAAIHMINIIIHHVSTIHDLLYNGNEYDYEWRFGKIHYKKAGKGKPLLLLHDLFPASSSSEWSNVLPLLSKNHTVYAIDLLGCGKSDKPNLTYTNFLYVQMISDFIKHIIHEPVNVVASGSAVPLIVMAENVNQNMIDKMIFVNPQDLHDLAKIPSNGNKLLYQLISLPILGTFLYNILFSRRRIKAFAQKSFYNAECLDRCIIQKYYESAHFDHMHSRYLFASIRGNYTKVNLAPFLSKITQSIFIIIGDADSSLKKTALDYQRILPSIEIISIENSKNFPQLEQPDVFCEQIEILLDPK